MSGPKLLIAGKEYLIAELSNEARAKCAHIDFCDNRMNQLQIELDVLRAAREAAIAALIPLLPVVEAAVEAPKKKTTRRKVH